MKVKVYYSRTELDRAVKFITSHNPSFIGDVYGVRESILQHIQKMAHSPSVSYTGTMGYLLLADWELEDLDGDDNICRIEILVDPALGDPARWEDDDMIAEVYTISDKKSL